MMVATHRWWLALALTAAVWGCKGKDGPAAAAAGGPPGAAAAGPPPAALEVAQTTEDLSSPDPNAAFWANAKRVPMTMLAQPAVAPRPDSVTTERFELAALHDGEQISFWLRWPDPEKSEAGRLAEFSDAFALEFPLQSYLETSVMMGSKGKPVQIFHWRAQYQHDAEYGKPDMKTLYPNGSIDMYAMDFKEAQGGTPTEKESFSPGRAEGNPQAYNKSGLDEIVAEGYSTSAVQEGKSGKARGAWADGHWTLVINRPLVVEGGSSLKDEKSAAVAFAAWQGGKGEVGSRKCITMSWLPIKLR